MREPGRDKERLQHIVEAADAVLEYSKGMSFEMFTTDKLRYGAIVYYTMLIGEAGYGNKIADSSRDGVNSFPTYLYQGISRPPTLRISGN